MGFRQLGRIEAVVIHPRSGPRAWSWWGSDVGSQHDPTSRSMEGGSYEGIEVSIGGR